MQRRIERQAGRSRAVRRGPSALGAVARRGRRLAGIAVTALMLALPLTIAVPAVSSAVAAGPPKIKVAISSDIDTLNPFLAVLATSTGIILYEYDSLVDHGPDNQLVAGLADKWETSSDGKTWTFHIPADRKWSDGQPLTADDVVWTFNAIKTTPALQAANGSLVASVASITAKDPQTVVIVLTAPQAVNPGTDLPIVPKHIWASQNAAKYADDKDVVGSGPYTVQSYNQSQSVEMIPNPHFWRGAPKNGGITYVYYKNGDAEVQALRTGEVDVVNGLTSAQFQSLKGQQGITTVSGAGRRYTALALNPGTIDSKGKPLGNGNPALKDSTLRKAIVMAIDNKTLLTRVLNGFGQQGVTEEPTVYPEYFGFAPGTTATPFDPAAANKLLDDDGYKKGPDGIRLDKQGKPLNLRLEGRNSDPTHAEMAQFVKGWLGDIGIGVTTTMVASNQVNNDSTLGKYDMYFTGWGLGPDPDFQLSINLCSSRPNADGSGATSENNWCDPAFDKVYKEQHTELNQAKRSALVKQAFTMISNAYVNDVVWYGDSLEAYRSDKFTGFIRSPQDSGSITNQNGYWGLYTAVPTGSSPMTLNLGTGAAGAGSSAGASSGAGSASGAAIPSSSGTSTAASTSNGGSGFPWWIVIVVVVIVVIAGALIPILRRRTKTAVDDRE